MNVFPSRKVSEPRMWSKDFIRSHRSCCRHRRLTLPSSNGNELNMFQQTILESQYFYLMLLFCHTFEIALKPKTVIFN